MVITRNQKRIRNEIIEEEMDNNQIFDSPSSSSSSTPEFSL